MAAPRKSSIVLGMTALVGLAAPAAAQAPAPAPAPVAPAPAPAPVAPAPAPAPPAPAPAPAAPAPAPAPAAPAPAPAPAPVAPVPPTPVEVAPPPAVVASEPMVATPIAPPEGEATHWYDALSFGAFVDTYLALDFNFPKGASNPIRAYDTHHGFSLAWVGLDVAHEAGPVGGTLALRFGPQAELLGAACVGGSCDSEYGLSNVKQAYASWRPGGTESSVVLDVGKFDTPYGAEVAESQLNINYTRGVLYWLGQPAYHTGLRLGADVSRNFALKVLAVNGWNRSIDNNFGKTVGVQGTLRLPREPDSENDLVSVSLGYMNGPEQLDYDRIECPAGQEFDPDQSPDTGCVPSPGSPGGGGLVDRPTSNTEGLRHFLDLTLIATPDDRLTLLLNGSFGAERVRDPSDLASFETMSWFGVMAGGRYAVNDTFRVAARGEYYGDPDGYTTLAAVQAAVPSYLSPEPIKLVTGTLTFDYLPAEALLLRIDARLDWSDKRIFPQGVRDSSGTAFSATLGAVVATD